MPMRIFFILLIMCSFAFCMQGNDKIITKKSEVIEAIVLEVNVDNLKYRLTGSDTGPIYTILKKDVDSVIYGNGLFEVFDSLEKVDVSLEKKMKNLNEGMQRIIPMDLEFHFDTQNLKPFEKSGGGWYYEGQKVNYYSMGKAISYVDPFLGKKIQFNNNLMYTGIGFIVGGGILMTSGLVPMIVADETDVAAVFLAVGSVFAVDIGLPMCIVGAVRRKKAVKSYNNWVYGITENRIVSPELKLVCNQNGVGIALTF